MKKKPADNFQLNLELSLVQANGTSPWKPDDGFILTGVNRTGATGNTAGTAEVYGTLNNKFQRYVFDEANMLSDTAALQLYGPNGVNPKVLKLRSGAEISAIQLADYEVTAGKDLSSDNNIGFSVNAASTFDRTFTGSGNTFTTAGMTSATENSTQLIDQVYLIGKSTATYGNTADNSANKRALKVSSGAGTGADPVVFSYWKPETDYEVKDIRESLITGITSVTVYSGLKNSVTTTAANIENVLVDVFQQNSDNIWVRTSTSIGNSSALEAKLNIRLNSDSELGLTKADITNATGVVKGYVGSSAANNYVEYIFAGQNDPAQPLGLELTSGPKLLKNADGTKWLPIAGVDIKSFGAKADNLSLVPTSPANIAYVMQLQNEKPPVFFDSTYKVVSSPLLDKTGVALALGTGNSVSTLTSIANSNTVPLYLDPVQAKFKATFTTTSGSAIADKYFDATY
jgi:hypothetical protein